MSIVRSLLARMETTLACAGVDPAIGSLPMEFQHCSSRPEERIWSFLTRYVDLTASDVCAYKVQKAFFDLHKGGHELLKAIIHYIHVRYPGTCVFVDCKVGDIGNTMAAYMENLFDTMDADGVVVNPYMGDEAVLELAKRADKAVIVLVRTSNPGSAIVQDVRLQNGQFLWEYMLDLAIDRWNMNGNIIPVLSSTADCDYRQIRLKIPQEMPILLAGVGAQGGDPQVLSHLLNDRRNGVFVNSSRDLMYPKTLPGEHWQESIVRSVRDLRQVLEEGRKYAQG